MVKRLDTHPVLYCLPFTITTIYASILYNARLYSDRSWPYIVRESVRLNGVVIVYILFSVVDCGCIVQEVRHRSLSIGNRFNNVIIGHIND